MLTEFLNAAKTIDVTEIVRRVLSRHTDELVALQKARLHSGVKTDNEALPGYSDGWTYKRRKAGKQTSVKDLDYTGGHYKDMFAKVLKDYTEMGSEDFKQDILVHNWGIDIYGLSNDEMDYLLWDVGLALEMATEYGMELLKN